MYLETIEIVATNVHVSRVYSDTSMIEIIHDMLERQGSQQLPVPGMDS